ncbi:MAG TPA: histidinol-phosphate transaminase [Acidimicrobiia bacterium]
MSGVPPVPARPGVQELSGYHSPQLDVAVRLNTNESPYPPPPAFVDAWLAALRGVPLNRYPDRDARRLRSALAGHLGQPVGRVFCANGSNEVLQTLLLAYGGPGRAAVTFEPTYALHSHIARITGTEVVAGERRADFTIDPEAAGRLVGEVRPTVVFVCSPNNPTGTVEPAATIDALVAAAPDALVVVDEAYGEFAARSAIELVGDDGRLVVVRTYSKVWSMAALRLGFGVAPPWVVAELEKVVLPYHLAVPTQLAGSLALDFRSEMDARIELLVRERDLVLDQLRGIDGVTPYPSGANFVLLRAAGDARALWEQLVARGVLVRDFSSRPRLEGCLRVTVGTHEENEAFVAALRGALEEVAA